MRGRPKGSKDKWQRSGKAYFIRFEKMRQKKLFEDRWQKEITDPLYIEALKEDSKFFGLSIATLDELTQAGYNYAALKKTKEAEQEEEESCI